MRIGLGVQQTLTVPPAVNAKTTQKHDYPSAAHRRSYRRRTAAERAYATIKDAATTNTSKGWCRLMGLTANALFIAAARRRPTGYPLPFVSDGIGALAVGGWLGGCGAAWW